MSLASVEVPPAASAELFFNLVYAIVTANTASSFRFREFGVLLGWLVVFFSKMLLTAALSSILQ